MGTYDSQITSALTKIRDKGQEVIWRSLSEGALPDADKPWEPGAENAIEHSVSIVFLPTSGLGKRKSQNYSETGDVAEGSLSGLMGGVGFAPKIKDVVIRDGVELVVESVAVLAPSGDPILYTLAFKS